ncbi:uncharacterized protein CLUP02_05448 [Colletotrichum lupini]|uniref:Uncharacterized protein n=1 Tax=Colletotrichum lupini TaxID=145971 RepID=A0A9Q8SP16_9PEZI|nr:uncharacterized protein CLUP02_05448 [Colletotrichum lupini]UQC79967.1 hypothetical protein CLUP02_05448 [Colletotrichum lupini]
MAPPSLPPAIQVSRTLFILSIVISSVSDQLESSVFLDRAPSSALPGTRDTSPVIAAGFAFSQHYVSAFALDNHFSWYA